MRSRRSRLNPIHSSDLLAFRCDGALAAYKHRGFWHPMDTLRDKMALDALWASGKAPWKMWEDREQGEASATIGGSVEARGVVRV